MFPPETRERFAREMGSSEAEWRRALPGAVSAHRLEWAGDGAARVHLADGGHLALQWQVLEPRRIGLARFARLQVDFAFESVEVERRIAFMRHFDLFMQRGGG